MTNQIAIVKTDARIQRCTISDPFRNYTPETEKHIKKFRVEENKALRQLKEVFRQSGPPNLLRFHLYDAEIKPQIKKIAYTSADVTKFSLSLAEFPCANGFKWKAGIFLSALITSSKETRFTIIIPHIEEQIHLLGYLNTKRIIVQGNIGSDVGRNMKCGSITINGNAGAGVGAYMERGSITVKGDSGCYVGDNMKNGNITIYGNTTYGVGKYMAGGSIFLKGDYDSLEDEDNIRGGNVFHKGKQIVKDGKVLI